jgi:hypothetical protein
MHPKALHCLPKTVIGTIIKAKGQACDERQILSHKSGQLTRLAHRRPGTETREADARSWWPKNLRALP